MVMTTSRCAGLAILVLTVCASAASAQSEQGEPLRLYLPPPPPPAASLPAEPLPLPAAPEALFLSEKLPQMGGTVELRDGTRLDVVLDTPLSTRISQNGQRVVFRTENGVELGRGLVLPAGTAFVGRVIEVARPGGFGRAGELRVSVDSIELPSGRNLDAATRLISRDAAATGAAGTDRNRVTDLVELAQYTLLGTWIGREVKGGKGAAVGAGAGAALAVILMASRRGPDLYLEPGTPYSIDLLAPVTLPASEVAAAQYSAMLTERAERAREQAYAAEEAQREQVDRGRPQLKRRPRR
jgi:hypothetical protein